MSNSILSRLSRKENQEHRTQNKSLKFKSHRVLRPADPVNSVVLDERQISQQLSLQFSLIDCMIQDYKMRIEVEGIPRKSRSSFLQDIFNLEETINFKDQQIARINQEIQQLKTMKYRQAHRSSLQNTASRAFTLTEELRQQRVELKEVMQLHSQKMNNQKILYLAIKRLEKVYQQKFPNRDTSYDNFKQKELENRRQEETKKKRREFKGPSIRQLVDNNSQPSALHKSSTDKNTWNRSMKELQDKKRIALMAIKNAKKKHQTEIAELNAKLQFLRDENALLNQKIRETELQRVHLMEKLHINVQNRTRSKERQYTVYSSPQ